MSESQDYLLVRGGDFVVLGVRWSGFRLQTAGDVADHPYLVAETDSATMRLTFPPQAITESTFATEMVLLPKNHTLQKKLEFGRAQPRGVLGPRGHADRAQRRGHPAGADQHQWATLIERILATDSGDDGFDIRSPATTLASNVAVRNRDLGIEAPPAVTDGGGNRARGNGNPRAMHGGRLLLTGRDVEFDHMTEAKADGAPPGSAGGIEA